MLPSLFVRQNSNLSPWANFDEFFKDAEMLFKPSLFYADSVTTPRVNIHEDESNILVDMEIPGVDKKDLSINISNGVLTISGEKKNQHQDKKARRKESYYGRFERSFSLPEDVKIEDITAKHESGVLKLSIPKTEKKPEPPTLKIEIQ